MTNQTIGTRLFPSAQIKSLIATLIEKGSITGTLKDAWIEKQKENEEMKDLFYRAERGDGKAMFEIYLRYLSGEDGFEKDHKLAFEWLKKAHGAKYVKGIASFGVALLKGALGEFQFKPQVVEGVKNIVVGAERGSNRAAIFLGCSYARGLYGFSVDKHQAIKWLVKGLDRKLCPYRHGLNNDLLKEAKATLGEMKHAVTEAEPFDPLYTMFPHLMRN